MSKVRFCKDCRHIVWTDNPMTTSHYWCIEHDEPCALDDFCSWFEIRGTDYIESIYDWDYVKEIVGEEEADRRNRERLQH